MGCCGKVVHGAVGLTKYALGLDAADATTVEARRAICRACEHAKPCKSNPARKCVCAKCGCRLVPKTALRSEACPMGKWGTA